MPPFTFGQSFLDQLNRGQERATSNADLQMRAKQVESQLLSQAVDRELARAQQALAEARFAEIEKPMAEADINVKDQQVEESKARTNLIAEETETEKTHRDLLKSRIGLNDQQINLIKATTGLRNEQILSEIENRNLTKANIQDVQMSTLFKGKNIEKVEAEIENISAQTGWTKERTATELMSRGLMAEDIVNKNLTNQVLRNELEFANREFTVKNGLGEPFGIEDGTKMRFSELMQLQRENMDLDDQEMRNRLNNLRADALEQQMEITDQVGRQNQALFDQQIGAANQSNVEDVLADQGNTFNLLGGMFTDSPVDVFRGILNPLNTGENREFLSSQAQNTNIPESDRQAYQQALDQLNSFGFSNLDDIPVTASSATPGQMGLNQAAVGLGRTLARYPEAAPQGLPSYGSAVMSMRPDNLLAPALQMDAMGRGFQMQMPQFPTNYDQ